MDRPQPDHLRPQRQTNLHSGPYDDPDHVLRTFDKTVGRKDFTYTIGVDLSDLPLTG